MFADQQLAPTVRKAWQMNSREDFRFDILRLIREGGIKDASPLARSVALNKKADEYHRIVAVQAAAACGDSATFSTLAKVLVKKPEEARPRLAAAFSHALYPQYTSTVELLKSSEKCQPPHNQSAEAGSY